MNDRKPEGASPVVAIPRVLWWFRQWPMWKTFFEAMGCRVVTNDLERPAPRHHDRSSTIVEEACYPVQLLIDRTVAIAGRADALFMPRLISVDRRGIMCPRFAGVPDIVRMVAGADCRVLDPVIDAREGRASVRRAYADLAAELGLPRKKAAEAFRKAATVQERFEEEFETRLNRLPARKVFDPARRTPKRTSGRPPFRVALLGHPYIAYDWEFSLGIVEKLRALGAGVVPVESVEERTIESYARRMEKNVYWTSGRDILGAALAFFGEGGVDGVIYLSCFKCGVDGLLTDVVRWAARQQDAVAYLPLFFDGHDNEVGLMTRLEAFVDILRHRRRQAAGVRASGCTSTMGGSPHSERYGLKLAPRTLRFLIDEPGIA